MSSNSAAVLDLIESYTDITIPEEAAKRDTFANVLYDVGETALASEQANGQPDYDMVAALEVIAASFARVQDREDSGQI